jgi:peroxiredoxin
MGFTVIGFHHSGKFPARAIRPQNPPDATGAGHAPAASRYAAAIDMIAGRGFTGWRQRINDLSMSTSAATPAATATLRDIFVHCRDLDASLAERLSAYSGAVTKYLPAYSQAVDALVARLARNGAGMSAPQPGEPMPPFLLPDENGRLTDLDSLLANGPLAITFHRGHWCPWCRISIRALVRVKHEIEAAGGHVVAIMPETQKFAAEFKADAQSPFPVLTDIDNGYALSLNLAIWIGAELSQELSAIGRSLPDYQGNDAWMLPIPATFVVGRDGTVRARFVDPDFRRRMAVEELIAALRSAR